MMKKWIIDSREAVQCAQKNCVSSKHFRVLLRERIEEENEWRKEKVCRLGAVNWNGEAQEKRFLAWKKIKLKNQNIRKNTQTLNFVVFKFPSYTNIRSLKLPLMKLIQLFRKFFIIQSFLAESNNKIIERNQVNARSYILWLSWSSFKQNEPKGL